MDFRNKSLFSYGFKDPVNKLNEAIYMKAKVNKTINIEDGKHTGKIKAIEYREKPYNYVDLVIEEKETELNIKCGVPFFISENSALGIMLGSFGCDVKKFIDQEIEIEDYFNVGQSVEFVTVKEKTEKGTFVKIIKAFNFFER